MPTKYVLKNGLKARVKDKPSHIATEAGDNLVLTDDLRGGVYGEGYDVVSIIEDDFFTRLSPEPDFPNADAADAFRYAVQLKQGEKKMSESMQTDGFYTIDYFSGNPVANLSDRTIFQIVAELQGELKSLSKLGKSKSKAVKAHQKRINRNINKLMAELDSRHK